MRGALAVELSKMLTFVIRAPVLSPRPRRISARPECARRPRRAFLSSRAVTPPPLVLGINQYSHDTSIAFINASSGAIVFALSKERLTRRKHDAGDPSSLIHHAVACLAETASVPASAILASIKLVVANNHHFRVRPYEERLPLLTALNYAPPSALSNWNLRRGKIELSHHLAHAFAAAHVAPFDNGLLLVMDGMGDALHDWQAARYESDSAHFCEQNLSELCNDSPRFREFPADVSSRPGASFREAETAYVFRRKNGRISLQRVFKRWTQEKHPSELANHSFEEMESVGAVYSRVAAILFRDWNACGKVMGLAPYARTGRRQLQQPRERYFMHGNIFDGTFDVSQGHRKGMKHIRESMTDPNVQSDVRRYFESIAAYVQQDLEDTVSDLVTALKEETGEQNLVFTGGVALNSTLNGVLTSRVDFEQVFIPPFPGDEGVAIGCAAFGFSRIVGENAEQASPKEHAIPFMPYLGKSYSNAEIMAAIEDMGPWITWEKVDVPLEVARCLAESNVVAWFRGRSEFGPRALGNRSLLADPRTKQMIDHVNKVVKKREAFRPFAPAVLAEHAHEWFEVDKVTSPFMSVTKQSKRTSLVEAVTHVDGTSRLQTVTKESNPEFHEMISRFRDHTGIPMVLNTSYNVAGEPIVESPHDALQTFLDTDGISLLAFPTIVVRRRAAPNFAEGDVVCSACVSFRSYQVQDSFGASVETRLQYVPILSREEPGRSGLDNPERSAELTDSLQLEVMEFVHAAKAVTVRNVMTFLLGEDYPVENDDVRIESGLPTADDITSRLVDLYNKRLIFTK